MGNDNLDDADAAAALLLLFAVAARITAIRAACNIRAVRKF